MGNLGQSATGHAVHRRNGCNRGAGILARGPHRNRNRRIGDRRVNRRVRVGGHGDIACNQHLGIHHLRPRKGRINTRQGCAKEQINGVEQKVLWLEPNRVKGQRHPDGHCIAAAAKGLGDGVNIGQNAAG